MSVGIDVPIPASFTEALKSSRGSAAGYSAVSSWLTCPEKSRLNAKGIKRRGASEVREGKDGQDELDDLSFGTLCHLLRAIRVAHGHGAMEAALDSWRSEIPQASWLKARFLFRTYESLYPRAQDGMQYLGVECEVRTDVGAALAKLAQREGYGLEPGRPIIRTVRYDTVVRVPGVGGAPDELFTFEAKTMSRSGQSSINPYMGQAMTQVALWNANENLVRGYGRMSGIIFDCLVKTATPNVERFGPIYFGRVHHKLALEYLALADSGGVVFGKQGNPTAPHYPRMLHACWGRWRACEYITGCHEEAWGEYEDADGQSLEAAP